MLGAVLLPLRVLVVCMCCVVCDEYKSVDVTKLAKLEQGTELVLIENTYGDKKSYRLEDFFWTGSGDGPPDEDETNWGSENPSIIYNTKTVISTVYIGSPATYVNQTDEETTTKCTHNCESPSTSEGEIQPTPTFYPDIVPVNGTIDEISDADRQFWLLTVLKSDGKDPVLVDLKNSLAKLYKTAFQRQYARHLGITQRSKRGIPNDEKPVNVYIYKIEKTPANGDEKIEVLYHVAVSGQPVAAITAADDMALISDDEVTNELGYPFLIKAEPYLKQNTESQGLSKSRSTWLFIGVALGVVFLLLLIVALLTLCISKRQKMGMTNRRKVFEQGTGHDNAVFVGDGDKKNEAVPGVRRQSSTYVDFRKQLSNQTLKSGIILNRPHSSSSASTTSGSSLDISPLMILKKKQRSPIRKTPRSRGAVNKTAPMDIRYRISSSPDTDTSSDKSIRDSPQTILMENYDPGVISPKSYLSMPSVKSFPRSNIPETLNKVLEPVSVLHLDMCDDIPENPLSRPLTRYGSMGATQDPGVIGPIVWNSHLQRLQHGVSVDEGMDDFKISNNASRMRKRFHELLDDTFSLFGSRRDSPIPAEENRVLPVEVKSHSANTLRETLDKQTLRPRPKTSDLRRVMKSPGSEPPRGAWGSNAPSPLVRPLSAGPFMRPTAIPQIDVDHILAEGRLQANDPAVPLIAAIKTELEKCSLPGSTTNLVE